MHFASLIAMFSSLRRCMADGDRIKWYKMKDRLTPVVSLPAMILSHLSTNMWLSVTFDEQVAYVFMILSRNSSEALLLPKGSTPRSLAKLASFSLVVTNQRAYSIRDSAEP